jgi:beta-lactamase class A
MALLLTLTHSAPAATLTDTIKKAAEDAQGVVAVACAPATGTLPCGVNDTTRAPMQSVFKLPLVVTVLHQVEAGKLSLDQRVHFAPEDRFAPGVVSPLQDKYPQGNVDVLLRDLAELAVAQSDNVAADILMRLAGGPAEVTRYMHSLGVTGFNLQDDEHGLHRDVTAQYRNWMTPAASHSSMLFDWMEHSVKPNRLKGDLPAGTRVAHKPGTSGVDNGIAHATNDIGLVTMPDGSRLAIAVFIVDSKASEAVRERVIARIARAIFDAGRHP